MGDNPSAEDLSNFFPYWQWKRRQIAGAGRVEGRLQSSTERRKERRRRSLDAASNCQLNEWRKWAESSEHVIQWDHELAMTCGGLIRLMGNLPAWIEINSIATDRRQDGCTLSVEKTLKRFFSTHGLWKLSARVVTWWHFFSISDVDLVKFLTSNEKQTSHFGCTVK